MKLKDILLEIKEDYKLYVDMDGVLTDFDKQFESFGKGKPDKFEKEHGQVPFWELIKGGGLEWWSEMPWKKDGKKLWDHIRGYDNVKILSAPAKTIPESRMGKMIWVNRELGSDYPLILYNNKGDYAGEKSILIDDRKDNTDAWTEAGGISILHKSAADTIKKLKELGI